MSVVSVVKCVDYNLDTVRKAVRRSLDLLGGIASFVKPGDRVLLKVSLLIRRRPEKATTTHPTVAQALAELIVEAGATPIIGDSPGGYHFYTHNTLESVYETCGMREAAEKSGAELNFDTDVVDVACPDGKLMKAIKTIKPILEVDKIISVPKIKTHAMMVYSGAVKNLFGIIPGSYKPEYHLRFEDADDFADVLVDICSFARPTLTVIDAVVGMEGYGPTSGRPKQIGLIVAGANPYELDVVATSLIGLQPRQVPTIRKSVERGLCTGRIEDVEIAGERIETARVLDYKIPTLKLSFNFYNLLLPRFMSKWLNKRLRARPAFDHTKCTGCGMCEKGCPPRAITMVNERPAVDLNSCIRCFCCHELCNYEAVSIHRPWIIKILLH